MLTASTRFALRAVASKPHAFGRLAGSWALAPALSFSTASSTDSTHSTNSHRPAPTKPADADTRAAPDLTKPHAKASLLRQWWSNDWIEPEAEELTFRAYSRHRGIGDRSEVTEPPLSKEELESMGTDYHYPAKTLGDKFAKYFVRALTPFTHAFFRDRYNHHACVLETVASVPGVVASALRHMRSLRNMKRDNGWLYNLYEEADNERIHLLTFMQVTQPTRLEKLLVLAAQGVYATAYAGMYVFMPRVAHRFVGYLEEEAVRAYTQYLNAIDAGDLPNPPAPSIPRKYYGLPDDASLRDVVLHVRADETMHRNANHQLAEMIHAGKIDQHPEYFDRIH